MSSIDDSSPLKDALSRLPSTAYANGCLWMAIQTTRIDSIESNNIRLIAKNNDRQVSSILVTEGQCHEPHIVAGSHGRVAVVWNEYSDHMWHIMCKFLEIDKKEIKYISTSMLYSSSHLCLPPKATFYDDELWVTWGAKDGNIRIRSHSSRVYPSKGLSFSSSISTLAKPVADVSIFR